MVSVAMAVVALFCFLATLGMCLWTRREGRRMDAMRADFRGYTQFYEWGKDAKVVVRDKISHEIVKESTLLGLFFEFERGRAFKHAMMLFSNAQFKVYVQEKAENDNGIHTCDHEECK